MAAQVLDEFVVKLGFDVAGLAKGQTEALSRLDGLEKKADHSRKAVAESGKGMGETFSSVRNQVFALTSAFIGFNALKNAVVDITKADAALGRLSRNLSLSPKDLKAFEGVGERFGATAGQMDDAFSHIAETMAQAKVGIYNPEMMTAMSRMGIFPVEFFDKSISDIDRFKLVADGLNKSIASGLWNRADALNFGGKMGFSPEVLTVMLDAKAALTDQVAEQRKMNEVNDADTAQAAMRAKAWNTATSTFEHYKRVVTSGLHELVSAEAQAAREKEGQTPLTWGRVGGAITDIAANPVMAGQFALDAVQRRLASHTPSQQTSTGEISRPGAGAAPAPSGAELRTLATQLDTEFKLPAGTMQGVLGGEFNTEGKNTRVSPKGAKGAWQLMPKTAEHYGVDPNDPVASGRAAAELMKELLTHYAGNQANAYGGYNAGQPNFDKMLKGTLPMAEETRGYIPRAMAASQSGASGGSARSGNTTTVTNNVTNNIDAKHLDATELHTKLQNNFAMNANAITLGVRG